MVFDNGALVADVHRPGGPRRRCPVPARRAARWSTSSTRTPAPRRWCSSSTLPTGFFGAFTGSAFRMANGNTLIGWGNNVQETAASEVDPDGNVVWTLQNPDDGPGDPVANYGSYRFHRAGRPRRRRSRAGRSPLPQDGAVYPLRRRRERRLRVHRPRWLQPRRVQRPVPVRRAPRHERAGHPHLHRDRARRRRQHRDADPHLHRAAPARPHGTPTTTTPTPAPTPTTVPLGPVPDAALVLRADVVGDGVQGVRQRARTTVTARHPVRRARIRLENVGDVAAVLTVRGPRSCRPCACARRWPAPT